jgi:hypothetical protein
MHTIHENRIASSLSAYLFERVFNQPNFEYRKNIIPQLIHKMTSTGSVKLRRTSLELPEENIPYRTYMFPVRSLGGINFGRITEWTSLVSLLQENRLELRIHNSDGVMLPRANVFIVTSPESNNLILAVSDVIMRKFFGSKMNPRDIYIATYFDSANIAGVSIDSYIIDAGSDVSTIFTKAQSADIVFVNGKYTTVTSVEDFNVEGNYVEVITDQNIAGSFEIDLADGHQRRNFVSQIDGESKTIVHIPKALNPTNRIISHSHCDFYLIARNAEFPNREGIFFHRALDDDGLTNITHNDIAIPDKVLNAYTDVPLNKYELRLVVVVKDHGRGNFLIRERNYIDVLYNNNDDEVILNYLSEEANDEEFTFWSAAHLEASAYTIALDDTPNDHPDVLGDQVDILGYNTILDLISARTTRVTLDTGQRNFKVRVPSVWEDASKVFPLVYINGSKLDYSLYTFSAGQSHDVYIHLDDSVPLATGQVWTVELFDRIPDHVTHITSSLDEHTVRLRSGSYVICLVHEEPSPIESFDSQYFRAYEDITPPPNNPSNSLLDIVEIDGDLYVDFTTVTYGDKFVVISHGGFSNFNVDVAPFLNDNNPVIFDLESSPTNVIQSRDHGFVLDNHTSPISSTGEVLHPVNFPVDPLIVYRQAWHVFSKDITIDSWDRRYMFATDEGPVDFKYRLDNALQSQGYAILGYKVGFLCNLGSNSPVRRESEEELNQIVNSWEVLVDGIIVDTVTDFNKWSESNDWQTFSFEFGLPIAESLTFRAINSRGGLIVSVPNVEFIIDIASLGPKQYDAQPIPMLGSGHEVNALPYFNTQELVRGVDFDINIITGSNGWTVAKKVVIQNVEYLETCDNFLEVITTRDVKLECVDGNTFDGILDDLDNELPDGNINANNIAIGSNATMSTTALGKGPKLAIDGNVSQEINAGSVALSEDHASLPDDASWEVSFFGDRKIARVSIWSARPVNDEFSNFIVQILDVNDVVVAEFEHPGVINNDGFIEINNFYSVYNNVRTTQSLAYYTGRSVKITLQAASVTGNRILQLAEVQVNEISDDFLLEGLNPIWYDGLSTATVDGVNVPNISEKFGDIEVEDYRVGALFGVRTSYPIAGERLLQGYFNTYDADLLRLVNTRYAERTAIGQGPVPSVTGTHVIYSLYLATIFRDMLESDDPTFINPDAMKLQEIVSDYAYLLEFDRANSPSHNFDYIDVFPYLAYDPAIDITPLVKISGSVSYHYVTSLPTQVLCDSTHLARQRQIDMQSESIVSQSSTNPPSQEANIAVDGDRVQTNATSTESHINEDPKTINVAGPDPIGTSFMMEAGVAYRFTYLRGAVKYLPDESVDILRYSGNIEIETPTAIVYENIFDTDNTGSEIQIETQNDGVTYELTATVTGIYKLRFADNDYNDNVGDIDVYFEKLQAPIGRAWWKATFPNKKAISTVSILNADDGNVLVESLLHNFTVWIEDLNGIPLAKKVFPGEAPVLPEIVINNWDLTNDAGIPTGIVAEYIEGYAIRIELNPYLGMANRILSLVEVEAWESDLYRQWLISKTIKTLGESQLPKITMI